MLHSHLHFELANNTQIRGVNNYWNLNIQYIKIDIQLGNEILQLFVFQTAQKAKLDFLHKSCYTTVSHICIHYVGLFQ